MEAQSILLPIFSLAGVAMGGVIAILNSRSIETSKVKASYLNYALQRIMDEYVKFDPTIDLSDSEIPYPRLLEARFMECRQSIVRVSPLIDKNALEPLDEIYKKYSAGIISQYNAKLAGREPELIDAASYVQMLADYIRMGHELLRQQIEALRIRLETGK